MTLITKVGNIQPPATTDGNLVSINGYNGKSVVITKTKTELTFIVGGLDELEIAETRTYINDSVGGKQFSDIKSITIRGSEDLLVLDLSLIHI